MFKHILFFILILSNIPSHGASSFFGKDIMRRFLEIEVTPDKILTKRIGFLSKKTPTQKNEFHLLVWNIYKGDLFKKSPLPINYKNFDLIFFQEYSEQIAPNFLPRKNFYFLPTFKWEQALTGVAIYSNDPLKIVTPFQTKYREPFILTPKASIISQSKGMTLINTHALNFVSKEEWIFELNEIAKHLEKKSKVIWAGDFNTWSIDRTQFLLDFMAKQGLEEVKFSNDNRTLHLGHPVDFIFIKGLAYKNAKAVKASDYSDHNPLTITIIDKKP